MGVKNLQNRTPNPSQSEPKWRQDWARTAKNSKNNVDPTKRWVELISVPPFCPKKWPTWPQVGSQVGAKMDKKSTQKSITKLMPPGIGFWKDFCGFWEGKWSQVGTKIH